MITNYLGNYPKIKIIEFLIYNRDKDHSISEIIIGASVKYRTLIKSISELLDLDLVFISRKIKKSSMYKINEFHPFIQALIFEIDIQKSESYKKGKAALGRLRSRNN